LIELLERDTHTRHCANERRAAKGENGFEWMLVEQFSK
jgi:hypothetical protein